MKDLTELVQKWEAEAQRLWGIADLGEAPIESAEANAEAGVYSMCADQLEKAIAANDKLVEVCIDMHEVLNRDGMSLEDSFEARYQAALAAAKGEQ